jgi:hypothetical protein
MKKFCLVLFVYIISTINCNSSEFYIKDFKNDLFLTDSREVILHLDDLKYLPEKDRVVQYIDDNTIKLSFDKPGEYVLNFKGEGDHAIQKKIVVEGVLNNTDTTFSEYDKKSVHLFTFLFFLAIILIILLTVYILFNLERIKKWWYRRSQRYFAHPEEMPSPGHREQELA